MNWISTIEPAPYRIAGFNLGPLRFGHCQLLERFDVYDLDTNERLNVFLGVCSRSYVDAREWLDTVGDQPVLRFKDKPKIKAQIIAYLHENMALPPTLDSVNQGEHGGTPFLQGLRNIAITQLGYSPDTILESRFGQLMWDVLGWRESRGEVRVIDDYMAQQLSRLEAMNAGV